MRQAVEVQVLNPHCELGEHGLRQILTDVIEEVQQSVNHDIDGAEILHSLLNAPWLQSLLKVYDCLQKHRRGSPVPALDYASGLSFQLLIDIRALPGCSEEARELYRLLRQPHLQALLSAHDTVAQKDYEPLLPPMPEDVPDDEEATRTICLVKNKQPLLLGSSPLRRGVRGHWGTLRRLTRQQLLGAAAESRGPHAGGAPRCALLRGGASPCGRFMTRRGVGRPCCGRLCYTDLLVNRSAPSVYSSVLIDLSDADGAGALLSAGPGTPRARTAPPSPMRPRRALNPPRLAPVELAKQESLDELRSTVQLAATSMRSNAEDIKLLGEKMAAATERMSETVQDNSQALVLLSQVVDRLQALLGAEAAAGAGQGGSPKVGRRRPTLKHQSRCSSSSSSTSSSSCRLDAPPASSAAPSTSAGTGCLPTSCRGSPRAAPKAKSAPLPRRKQLNARLHVSPNGAVRGGGKKRDKKPTSGS